MGLTARVLLTWACLAVLVALPTVAQNILYAASIPNPSVQGNTRQVMWSLQDNNSTQFQQLGVTGNAVEALVFHDGTLFVGGNSMVATNDPDQQVSQLFSFTGRTWSRPAVVEGGRVRAITQIPASQGILDNSPTLFLGGDFQFVADMETPRLAMEDNDQGVWTGMGGGVSQSGGGSAYVTSLSRGSGFRIYVGGNFDAVNGTAASNVAYFVNSPDGMQSKYWDPMGDGVPSPVVDMTFEGNRLYTVGEFGVSYYSESTSSWTMLATVSGTLHSVAVTEDGSYLFVGGEFSSLTPTNGNSFNTSNLAVFNTNTETWFSQQATGGAVYSIITTSSSVFVGGDFTALNGVSILSLGRVATSALSSSGSSLPFTQVSFNPSVLGRVVALAYGGTGLTPVPPTPGVFNGAMASSFPLSLSLLLISALVSVLLGVVL